MGTIAARCDRHATSREVYEYVVAHYNLDDGSDMPDSMAAAIASWWQSPDPDGAPLATLASGLPVDRERLQRAAAHARWECERAPFHPIQSLDTAALIMLFVWAGEAHR